MSETSGGDASRGGVVETRAEEESKGGPEVVRFWRQQIALAGKEEEKWRDSAKRAVDQYAQRTEADGKRWNILYANVETLLPSIFNSEPVPDVRRRFGDPGTAEMVAAQALERSLVYFMDVHPFEQQAGLCVLDSLVPGRGVARVRYEPQIGDGGVSGIETFIEHVGWEDYRQSPAREWADVRWVAYRHKFTREQLKKLNPRIGARMNLSLSTDGAKDGGSKPSDIPDIYKRSECWEIWDRERREVLFISEDWNDGPIQKVSDPYGLRDFWCQPEPIYDVVNSTSLTPVCPYDLYKIHADELNVITRRITGLARILKWRGLSAGQADALAKLADADDGEILPLDDIALQAALTQGGDLGKLIWLWPIDKAIQVLREMIAYRETIKATIYEITGVSDIIRGQTDPNETLGAQQIKSQWGSLRLQRRQRGVQRFCRDLLRIMAEIVAEKMPVEQMAALTNIKLPSAAEKQQAQQAMQMLQQAQQQAQGQQLPPEAQQQMQQVAQQAQDVLSKASWEEVQAILKSDTMRCYRIDIETDSTIQNDVTRAQQNLSQFVQSIGALMTGALPVMQSKPDMVPVILETLKSTARTFKLGKALEDAIEKVGPEISPPPGKEGQQGDPAAEAQATIQAEQTKAQASLKAAEMKAQADMQAEQMRAETSVKVAEMNAQTQLRIKEMDLAARQQEAQMDAAIQMQTAQEDARRADDEQAFERERVGAEMDMRREEATAADAREREKIKAAAAAAKAKASARPQARA